MSVQAEPQHYAKAIYDLALDRWVRQLGEVQQVLQRDARLREAVSDLRTPTNEKLQLLGQSVRGGLDAEVRKFLGTLLTAGDLDQLGAILAEFSRMVRRGPALKTARVTTAVPLTDAEQQALRSKVTARFGPDLDFQFEVDPAVIGGVLLRVGDQVIDGTVAAKLAALRDQLAA